MTEAVSDAMRVRILAELERIEADEDVRVLFAVESGSRAWGFHSTDSDYDVRFVYVRPVEAYLSLHAPRDVIEMPIDDELDISGWDLQKALKLALGSNAVIAEWLQSPEIYRAVPGLVEGLSNFCQRALRRRNVAWHYRSLYHKQAARLAPVAGEGVRLKRYFYCLRPALALRWMRLNAAAMPPMDMTTLMSGCDLPPEVIAAIDALIAVKKQLTERGQAGASDPLLDTMMADEMHATDAWLARAEKPAIEDGLGREADLVFRRIVLPGTVP